MDKKFLLLSQPRYIGFKLEGAGNVDSDRDFVSIPEAFAYVRALPDTAGATFTVIDDRGREMATLTV